MCLPRTHSQSHSSTVLPLHSEPTDSALSRSAFSRPNVIRKKIRYLLSSHRCHTSSVYIVALLLHTCQYYAMILSYCFCCVTKLVVTFLVSPCYIHSYIPYHNKKEQKFISLLTSTTSYCIIGTEVHELLFLVYRNSCSLSSRLYKKIAASHQATFPSGKKQQNIPHGGMT